MKRFLFVLIFLCASCENASFRNREKGALAGGAMGAGLGAIVGNQTGNSGAGIAIGAGLGALAGAIIGNTQDRNEDDINAADDRISQQEKELLENKKILDELRARGADVRSTKRGIVVNLPDVLFEFDSSRLTSEAKNTAADIAEVVRKYENKKISVEGHTDSVGTVNYNLRLSRDRARSVANELNAQGIPGRSLSTRGLGESDPIASNQSETGRKRNRRVEVIIENS
jgi:outer membrane protein OmpA-like peptidoglycan-associated protein